MTWSSGDPSVVTVSRDGLVTAAGHGEATITATSGAASGSARLTVDQIANSVDVSPAAHTLTALDDTLRLAAALDGRIYSPNTGIYYDHLRATSADHIVARTEAHDSGGCAWSGTERRAFVHDIENLALAASSLDRGIKAANDAAEWLPDFNQCWYAGAIVAVRLKYELTVDEAERDALEEVLASCESTEMVFSPETWTIEAMTLGDESSRSRGRSPETPRR
ncbi:Ig-like domain-containing protein [Candidatus Palauibacter sp.]|uniref:Ig-like domain-containing protein n=1 Tax=Candidatus Palauibacter sp. TaxID=3101350 RepID=UPI003AF2278F